MTTGEIEDLYLRSLDDPLTPAETELLLNSLSADTLLASDLVKYDKIRQASRRNYLASFGPYFSGKVIEKITRTGWQIDKHMLLLFKQYQLAALGVVVALLALNAVFAEQLSVPALFGLENPAAPVIPIEDIESFDFYEMLNADI